VNVLLALAIALTRAWTRTYTRGLPLDLRAQRREEVDCDLWEQAVRPKRLRPPRWSPTSAPPAAGYMTGQTVKVHGGAVMR
jgi:hypothetical protein